MALHAVRSLVVDSQHVLFVAENLDGHLVKWGLLFNLPRQTLLALAAAELSLGHGPELGKIKLIRRSLIPYGREQLLLKRKRTNLRASATDIEHGILQLLAGNLTGNIIGRQPYPWAGEILAPVLVCISVAGILIHHVVLTVPVQITAIGGLHALGMPEHLEGFHLANGLGCTVTYVEGNLLVDVKIPHHLTGFTHILRMGSCFVLGHLHLTKGTGLGQEAFVCGDEEWKLFLNGDVVPAEESMHLASIRAPGTNLHHQIAWLNTVLAVLFQLAEDRCSAAQFRVDCEELYEECLLFSGVCMMSGK